MSEKECHLPFSLSNNEPNVVGLRQRCCLNSSSPLDPISPEAFVSDRLRSNAANWETQEKDGSTLCSNFHSRCGNNKFRYYGESWLRSARHCRRKLITFCSAGPKRPNFQLLYIILFMDFRVSNLGELGARARHGHDSFSCYGSTWTTNPFDGCTSVVKR